MSEQDRNGAGRPATSAGAPPDPRPDEVGQGPGLDPPSAPPDDDDQGDDEAYADRPARGNQGDDEDGAAIQRPPADS